MIVGATRGNPRHLHWELRRDWGGWVRPFDTYEKGVLNYGLGAKIQLAWLGFGKASWFQPNTVPGDGQRLGW